MHVEISNNATLNQRLAKEYGLHQNASTFRLEDFNYNSDMLTDIMLEYIKTKSFTGVTVSTVPDRLYLILCYNCYCREMLHLMSMG